MPKQTARERAIKEWSRGDNVIALMLRRGRPITLDNYCIFAGIDRDDFYALQIEGSAPDFLTNPCNSR